MSIKIVGLVGFIGSGKGTVASYLVQNHNFTNVSFAGHLKDAVANVFGWPRNLLEGDNEESRKWREQQDRWWAKRLDIPHLTPRWVLQNWGTEVLRQHFHDDIWIASLENKLLKAQSGNFVISDVRFPNEMRTIQNLNGSIWRVQRGELPVWATKNYENFAALEQHMKRYYPMVHSSEWNWILNKFNTIIYNNGSLKDLHKKIETCLMK